MDSTPMQSELGFLCDGGEMGALTRAYNWAATPIGSAENWPQSLRNVLSVLLNSTYPMFIWWGPHLIQFYNDAFRLTMGQGRHPGALGQPGRECWAEIWSTIGPQIESVMAGNGSSWHVEQYVPFSRNGRLIQRWWTYGFTPIADEDGSVAGIFVVCDDVTGQYLARRDLQQTGGRLEVERHEIKHPNVHFESQNNRLRALFKDAPSFIAVFRGPQHILEFTNAAYLQLLDHRQVDGVPAKLAFPEDQKMVELLDQVFLSGKPFINLKTPVKLQRRPSGPIQISYIDFVYQPIKDQQGMVSGIFVEGIDVTEWKQAEDTLKELNATVEQQVAQRTANREILWGEAAQPMLLINFDGSILRANPACAAQLGWDPKELEVRPLVDLVRPEDRSRVQQELMQLRTGKVLQEFRLPTLRKDGSAYMFSWTVIVEGELIYAIGRKIMASDPGTIETRIPNDVEILLPQETPTELSASTSNADFNNLLQSILGSLENVQKFMEEDRGNSARRHIDAAIMSREQAMLTPAGWDATHQAVEELAVNMLITSMANLIHRSIGDVITPHLSLGSKVWFVACEKEQLQNAILTLITNACSAMPNGGEIIIETMNANFSITSPLKMKANIKPGEYVCISVSDTGATDTNTNILEQPLDTLSNRLRPVSNFANQLGGHLVIDSTYDRGSRVQLYLPRYYSQQYEELSKKNNYIVANMQG